MREEDRRGESTGGGTGPASDDDDESDGAATAEAVKVLRGSAGDTDGDGANAKAVSGGDLRAANLAERSLLMTAFISSST
ncbi:hypothetical protein ACFX13_028979 [Malus domestica]